MNFLRKDMQRRFVDFASITAPTQYWELSRSRRTLSSVVPCLVLCAILLVALDRTVGGALRSASSGATRETSLSDSLRTHQSLPSHDQDPYHADDRRRRTALYGHSHNNRAPPACTLNTSARDDLYFQWESDSINGHCHPPENIPARCCVGASTEGMAVSNRILGMGVSWDKHWKACRSSPYHCSAFQSRDGSRNINDVLNTLIKNNWTLTVTGDSMMQQVMNGMECEWLRQGWFTTNYHQAARVQRGFWRYGTSSVHTWQVGISHNATATATIKYYHQYRPYVDMREMHEILDTTDVLLINFGVHWWPVHFGGYEDYLFEMMNLLATLKRYAEHRVIFWREQIAQFHNSEGGEWDMLVEAEAHAYELRKKRSCADVSFSERILHQWRDKNVTAVAHALQMTIQWLNKTLLQHPPHPLYWMPIYQESLGWTQLHPTLVNNDRLMECTHVCQTPYMWSNIWKYMAKGLKHATHTQQVRAGIPAEKGDIYTEAAENDFKAHREWVRNEEASARNSVKRLADQVSGHPRAQDSMQGSHEECHRLC